MPIIKAIYQLCKCVGQENNEEIIEENDEICINVTVSTSTSSSHTIRIQQSDIGANISTTNNFNMLSDVVYIKPISIDSANTVFLFTCDQWNCYFAQCYCA